MFPWLPVTFSFGAHSFGAQAEKVTVEVRKHRNQKMLFQGGTSLIRWKVVRSGQTNNEPSMIEGVCHIMRWLLYSRLVIL